MPETLQPTEVLSDRVQLTDLPELTDLLLTSQKIRLVIQGFSMYPALRPRDVVEVAPIAKGRVEVGDIVAFQKEKKLICHRLIEIFEEDSRRWLRTQGDAMASADSPLCPEEVLGRVVSIERRGKTWEPSGEISKPSLGDRIFFTLNRCAVSLRNCLASLQSFRSFRFLYRTLLRRNVSYAIGLPTHSHPRPRFWHYRPQGKEEELREGNSFRFLAKVGKDAVGSLEIRLCNEEERRFWSISHLFVRTRYRGCGVATTLMKSSFQLLRRREDASVLKVEVASHNHPAVSFFKKLGFSAISREGAILFQKELPCSFHMLNPGKEYLIQNAARQLLFEQALFEIDTAFKEKEIEYLVLKGMARAYLIYPDPAARSMVDVDLYLHAEDIPRAIAGLKDLGYQMHEEEFKEELLAFSGEFAFYKTRGPLIELHSGLEQYERLKGIVTIDEKALWDRTASYQISGKTFKTLCPEHQLLSLSIHLGLVHRFEGLKWFLDIDRLLIAYGKTLYWEELLQTAKRWKVERVVAEVLLTTQELFNTPMPSLSFKKRPSFLRKAAFQWCLLDRPQDQIRVLWRIFYPSREWLIYRYRLQNRKKVFCYRLLHPFLVVSGKTR